VIPTTTMYAVLYGATDNNNNNNNGSNKTGSDGSGSDKDGRPVFPFTSLGNGKGDNGTNISIRGLTLLLTFLTVGVLVCVLLPFVIPRLRRIWRRRLETNNEEDRRLSVDEQGRIQLRYSAIESWLVSKQVLAHDDLCRRVLQHNGKECWEPDTSAHGKNRLKGRTMTVETLISADDDSNDENHGEIWSECDNENEGLECPVCMDSIQVGAIVSWSANPKCRHYFHHACIKEWLLKHSDCPFCRECFLPTDQMPSKLSMKHISELIVAQQHRSAHCFFCLEHGVVALPNKLEACFAVDSDGTKALWQRASAVPSRQALVTLRKVNREQDYLNRTGSSQEDEDDLGNDSVGFAQDSEFNATALNSNEDTSNALSADASSEEVDIVPQAGSSVTVAFGGADGAVVDADDGGFRREK
jgi:hypothetical protein